MCKRVHPKIAQFLTKGHYEKSTLHSPKHQEPD